jgi:hypothetical protein
MKLQTSEPGSQHAMPLASKRRSVRIFRSVSYLQLRGRILIDAQLVKKISVFNRTSLVWPVTDP